MCYFGELAFCIEIRNRIVFAQKWSAVITLLLIKHSSLSINLRLFENIYQIKMSNKRYSLKQKREWIAVKRGPCKSKSCRWPKHASFKLLWLFYFFVIRNIAKYRESLKSYGRLWNIYSIFQEDLLSRDFVFYAKDLTASWVPASCDLLCLPVRITLAGLRETKARTKPRIDYDFPITLEPACA